MAAKSQVVRTPCQSHDSVGNGPRDLFAAAGQPSGYRTCLSRAMAVQDHQRRYPVVNLWALFYDDHPSLRRCNLDASQTVLLSQGFETQPSARARLEHCSSLQIFTYGFQTKNGGWRWANLGRGAEDHIGTGITLQVVGLALAHFRGFLIDVFQ